MNRELEHATSTTNACKLCKPMGACLAFRGIEGAVPFLHGSQGCATYMRRYIISHFNEPMDIASSSLGEKHAIYGGGPNFRLGVKNVTEKYRPSLIGVATTCLTETIGDDVAGFVGEIRKKAGRVDGGPSIVHVSTPSYGGTHMEGFHAAVRATVEQLAEGGERGDRINMLPGFVSPADIRYLKEVLADFGAEATILPDLSDTLDGPALREYRKLPAGGTSIREIRSMGGSRATIEFGRTLEAHRTAGAFLAERFQVPNHRIGLPVGIRETDRFFAVIEDLSGRPTPERHAAERGRLVDSLVDGHKYIFGLRAVVYGEEDLVAGIVSSLAEFGVRPVLCASGGESGLLAGAVHALTEGLVDEPPIVRQGADFFDIGEEAEDLSPDIIIGHSKGYHLARRLGIPLLRVGFPIHDRIGGQRIVHLGYRGAQWLFDSLVNTVIAGRQESSPVGYGYY